MAEITTATAVKHNRGILLGLGLLIAAIFAYYYFTKGAKTPETKPTPEPTPEPEKMTQEQANALARQIIGTSRMGASAETKANNDLIKSQLTAAGYNLSCTGSIDVNTFNCLAVKA